MEEKTEKRIEGIEKLEKKKEEELRNLFIIDNEHIDLLLVVDANERDIQEELIIIESKLEKLKISEKTVKAIKSQIIGL